VLGSGPGEEPSDPDIVAFHGGSGLRFSRERQTHATLSILQEAVPELLTSATRWRNPWHERQLYAIEY